MCAVIMSGCGIAQNLHVDLKPVALHVAPKPDHFAGDTLILSLIEERKAYTVRPPGAAPVMRTSCASLGLRDPFAPDTWSAITNALAGTLRAAFPNAVVVESSTDTMPSPRRIRVSGTLSLYQATYGEPNSWLGRTDLEMFVRAYGERFVTFVSSTTRSPGRHRPLGEVGRESFDSASQHLVAFLDSLATPALRDRLRETAGVDAAAFAPSLATTGTATLSGRVSYTTAAGDVIRPAGQLIVLDPVTPASIRWYEHTVGSVLESPEDISPDDLSRRVRRTTVGDQEGNFAFTKLPPGTYLVRTCVAYDGAQPGDLFRSKAHQGAIVSAIVSVSDGGRQSIELSRTGDAFQP